ncbi:similar to Saccharomyces cerevisiae YBR156C SLI15 Subunit of the conserved chromosomal passenger complex (CPCIpl1p-Sli15p-Bir1p-Nbl1p) [Maudiozyma saulgeensis]|uniref:Similar to Saccharomyces cerevisiae YBR156C SLI15 Subunit of the conserved chromosomal passenger complex (CPCIpl1p-Sli15p-Bir1p-Nbl1p) n=1 Tax=Maudiozyma saulgeensis TaxID=1789683 RepID=A0A1X7R5J6_9SACH|nr:similar to Saccharomyces cerevisiae YBR156C SLI15 Subunit of the conserved chromosomal passenger complex (CPCIpl1p-Sli15p-Bir1p-Nbl1p) [Kazachstania saulgeensis]
MDWTIEAARMKDQKPAGGSRSIVESLNQFNNIDNEFNNEINSKINNSLNWLYKIQRNHSSVFLSPERTEKLQNNNDDKENDQPFLQKDNDFTPKRPIIDDTPLDVTPLSLRQNKDLTTTINEQKIQSDTKSTNETKLSPWSPYKIDQSLKMINKTKDDTESVIINNDDKNDNTSKFTMMSLNSTSSTTTKLNSNNNNNTTITTSMVTNKSPNVTLTRMKRRSNMFVPMPKKDPLTVHDSMKLNQNHTFSGTTLKINKQPNLSPKNPLNSNKQTNNNHHSRSTQSPIGSRNVFDRLSSTSTQSFNKKITNRTHIMNKKHTTSSIDLSGSPLKRNSSAKYINGSSRKQLFEHDNSNWHVRETLKNIFAVEPENLKSADNNNQPSMNNVRRSLIPSLDNRNLSLGKDKRHSINIGSNGIHKDINPSQSHDKNLSIIGEEKSSRVKESSTSTIVEAAQNTNNTQSEQVKRNNDHRLTKFQLLRAEEPNKQDLKKKLNKRLSEVMKTQQESEKHKRDKQKRLITNDASTKHRTKNFSEFKSFGTTHKLGNTRRSNTFNNLSQTSDNEDASIPKPRNGIDTRNILDALNTGDYRRRVGDSLDGTSINEGNPKEEEATGNMSLPEIFSDSDQEDTSTLTEWARAPYLQEQLRQQQNWDYKKIFGPVAPLHIDEIFNNSRLDKFKSSSHLNK